MQRKLYLALTFGSIFGLGLIVAPFFQNPRTVAANATAQKAYELRTYTTHPGRLDALNKRFRDHTCGLFQKHGMELVGFWTPQDDKDGKADTLIYLLAYPSRDDAKKSWDAFQADEDWKKAREASEKDGPIVKKVSSVFLDPTDYSNLK